MKLQIRVDDNGVISDVKFKTFGCGSAIASSSYMTERVKGMTLEQAGNVKNTEIAKELCLPPVKRMSPTLPIHILYGGYIADNQYIAPYSLRTLSNQQSRITSQSDPSLMLRYVARLTVSYKANK
jgi:hypothetical protein